MNRNNVALDAYVGPGKADRRKLTEAYDWLLFNRLIAADITNELGGWAYVTGLGREVAASADPTRLIEAQSLLGRALHDSIANAVFKQFVLGEYEQAAVVALRQVEIRVRELGGFGKEDIGVPLMRKAFSEGGPLADSDQEAGEVQATAHLFAGAIGTFKNPISHRQVDYDDPLEAVDVVFLADLLHRMLDRVALRLTSPVAAS